MTFSTLEHFLLALSGNFLSGKCVGFSVLFLNAIPECACDKVEWAKGREGLLVYFVTVLFSVTCTACALCNRLLGVTSHIAPGKFFQSVPYILRCSECREIEE